MQPEISGDLYRLTNVFMFIFGQEWAGFAEVLAKLYTGMGHSRFSSIIVSCATFFIIRHIPTLVTFMTHFDKVIPEIFYLNKFLYYKETGLKFFNSILVLKKTQFMLENLVAVSNNVTKHLTPNKLSYSQTCKRFFMTAGVAVVGGGIRFVGYKFYPGVSWFLGIVGCKAERIQKFLAYKGIKFLQDNMRTKPAAPKLDSSDPVIEPTEATLPSDIVVYTQTLYDQATTAKVFEDLYKMFKLFLTYE